MIEKIGTMWPEITLFAFTCVVMIVGLSKSAGVRSLCAPLSILALVVAGVLAWGGISGGESFMPNLAGLAKVGVCVVGVLLVLLAAGSADRDYEAAVARGQVFNPLRSTKAEFYALMLFSLTGLMLVAGSDDLIMLFLALELTSLPTYVMVTISTPRNRSMEAGVKYFFLGALGAAIFLYGFVLIYGGTGTTSLAEIHALLADHAPDGASAFNTITIAGVVLAVLGLCFKIAAVPMHFYTPDVYQGASASVGAFLAFVPKTAGFLALMFIVGAVGWNTAGPDGVARLPAPLGELLWIIAALTMTVGNVLAVRQRSIKRILAYSSIAHSGYMLVGLLAGPGLVRTVGGASSGDFAANGLAAVLFYLFVYGVTNIGCFAVVACLNKTGRDGHPVEIDDVDDIRGLCATRPLLGWTMVLCSVSLLGFPPLIGFFAKVPLFTSAIAANQIVLVVILGVNSAIAAFYYLRLASAPLLEQPDFAGRSDVRPNLIMGRSLAGLVACVSVIALAAYPVTHLADSAGKYRAATPKGTSPLDLEGASLELEATADAASPAESAVRAAGQPPRTAR